MVRASSVQDLAGGAFQLQVARGGRQNKKALHPSTQMSLQVSITPKPLNPKPLNMGSNGYVVGLPIFATDLVEEDYAVRPPSLVGNPKT